MKPAEAGASRPNEDGDRAASESIEGPRTWAAFHELTLLSEPIDLDEGLASRMVSVLNWIANGDPARFDDYSRIAGELVEEARNSQRG